MPLAHSVSIGSLEFGSTVGISSDSFEGSNSLIVAILTGGILGLFTLRLFVVFNFGGKGSDNKSSGDERLHDNY